MLRRIVNALLTRFECTFRQLFIMYLMVFCLPLLVTLLLSENSARLLETQIQNTATAMTQQVQNVIDARMHDVSMLIDQINNHTTIRYLLNRSGELSSADRYMATTVINDLRRQYANSSLVEDLFIYFANTDSVISTISRSDSRFFYEHYYSYEQLSYGDWLRLYMRTPHEMTVLPAQPVFNGVSTKRLLTVFQALPRDSGTYQTGMISLFIDEGWLMSQVKSQKIADMQIQVFSKEGERLLFSGDGQAYALDTSQFQGDEGFFTAQLDGRSMYISYVRSAARGWYYVNILPVEQFFAKVNQLRSLMLCALIVALLIGIVLAGVLAYLSLMPVRTVLNTVQESDSSAVLERLRGNVSIRNLGAFVREAIENQSIYTKQLPLLIETYVFKLLNGYRDVESELKLFSEVLGFRFPTNQFAVMSFFPDKGDDLLAVHQRLRPILETLGRLDDAGMDCYSALSSEHTISILMSFWAGSREEYREIIHRQANRMMRILSQETGKRYAVGVSLVCIGYEEISGCYRQSMLCVANLPPTERERVVFYADIARVVPPSDYSYPLEVEKALIACVCAGDVKRLNRLLDEVFVNHEQEARMVAGMTQCLKFDMMGTLFRCVQDFSRDNAADCEQSLGELTNDMFRLEEPERIYEAMRKAFTRLCDFAYANKRSHNDELRDRILSYMAENYTNPDMGLDMVARAFGIAPGYLSRFFKEQTGGNFVDHVNRLRIECAAQLLRTSELTHAEIAEACGLSGSQALNRLFNRILSVSPSTYRQMARQGRFESSV